MPNRSSITLRPVCPQDQRFLLQVYASTRQAELAQVDWNDAEKGAFLAMQFAAQSSYYQEHYPQAAFQVIVQDGTPVGRLYVDRWVDEIRIMDIALLPEFRNRGIGSHLLQELLLEAGERGKAATIHVEKFNPALSLYSRLGFLPMGEVGVYWFMKWSPNT